MKYKGTKILSQFLLLHIKKIIMLDPKKKMTFFKNKNKNEIYNL
jgi:hypothetical protein